MIYLSGCHHIHLEAAASMLPNGVGIGVLITLTQQSYMYHEYEHFGIDNECFAKPDAFDLDRYIKLVKDGVRELRGKLMFATAPDVVGEWPATLKRSLPVLPLIRAAGCPAALVAQDGATTRTMPWNEFDVLFLGGSTEWKLGMDCYYLCQSAKYRGITVHMGRVNSKKRLHIADDFGCVSADGTHLRFKGGLVGARETKSWLMSIYQRQNERQVS